MLWDINSQFIFNSPVIDSQDEEKQGQLKKFWAIDNQDFEKITPFQCPFCGELMRGPICPHCRTSLNGE
jgi:uncharacterized OB-fold protein